MNSGYIQKHEKTTRQSALQERSLEPDQEFKKREDDQNEEVSIKVVQENFDKNLQKKGRSSSIDDYEDEEKGHEEEIVSKRKRDLNTSKPNPVDIQADEDYKYEL